MKKTRTVWFVIVTYKPDPIVMATLGKKLTGNPVIEVNNTYNNVGYGGGANKGMKKAFDMGARWVVVVNQDVALTKESTRMFVKVLEDCAPGVVGPEAGTFDPKRWTTVLASRPGLERVDDRVLYISGSMMAIHRDVWQAIGGFFEPYFMYYEDADISVRAKNAGFRLQQIRIDGFQHKTGTSNEMSKDNEKKEYYLARNHLWFVWRLAPWRIKFYELLRLPKTMMELLLNIMKI